MLVSAGRTIRKAAAVVITVVPLLYAQASG
jgi:hypothetical protein